MDFQTYIKYFTGKDIKDPLPGEHHFVSLCLVPQLINAIDEDKIKLIEYINPDGMKNRNASDKIICDLTYNGIGIEVKYSRNMSLNFTSKQLRDLKKLDKNRFLGFIALVGITKSAKVIYIDADNFFRIYEKQIKRSKTKNYCRINIDERDWRSFTESVSFTKLFTKK
jgi:hypothetical protein